ncbi:MAG TPA: hypothetical protein VMV29_19310 [Ktedonobacterales bacterium]|nr:hypothetical protein [Ktedonobacterales bacterium]
MRKYRIHRSLALVAVVLGALAASFMVAPAPSVGVVSAAQAQDTATSSPAAGVISLQPTLTWKTPSNSDPTGVPGETVTIAGSGFDISAGAFLLQLETTTAANAGCPAMITPTHFISETATDFQATFTLDATAKAGSRFIVCAFPSGKGQAIHSTSLTIVAPTLCVDGVCSAGATDNVAHGRKTITVTGADWEPIGGLVTVTLCCAAAAAPSPSATHTPTSAPQSQPTRTPIVVPTIPITPPVGQGLDQQVSVQRFTFASAPITQTASITPCADNAARGCFSVSVSLPANAQVGATFTVTAQAQGNVVVTPGATVKIIAPPTQSGGALSTLGAAVPELFAVIVLLLLVMAGILIWLATQREVGVGRQL